MLAERGTTSQGNPSLSSQNRCRTRASSGSSKALVSPKAFLARCFPGYSSLASEDGGATSPSGELA
jgi:hypothetical protein